MIKEGLIILIVVLASSCWVLGQDGPPTQLPVMRADPHERPLGVKRDDEYIGNFVYTDKLTDPTWYITSITDKSSCRKAEFPWNSNW